MKIRNFNFESIDDDTFNYNIFQTIVSVLVIYLLNLIYMIRLGYSASHE